MDELTVVRSFRTAVPAASGRERSYALKLLNARIEAETSARAVRPRRLGRPRGRTLILAFAVAAAIAIPAAAFGGQIGRFIGSLAEREAARDALPDTAVMDVFERPRTADDALPPSGEAVAKQFGTAPVDPAISPGVGDTSDSRRALAGAGESHASLYLVPTSKGTLCMIWVPDIGGGCTQGFMPGVDVIFVRGSRNGVSQVWGIFRDTVKNIRAVVGSQTRPVVQGSSSFLYEGPTLPDQLVIERKDGTTSTIQVSALQTLKSG